MPFNEREDNSTVQADQSINLHAENKGLLSAHPKQHISITPARGGKSAMKLSSGSDMVTAPKNSKQQWLPA